MQDDKRYSLTVGMSINDASVNPLTDYGLRYGDLRYEDMVAIQSILSEHEHLLTTALKPVRNALLEIGFIRAAERAPEKVAKFVEHASKTKCGE